jgi:hypothetical protein
LALLWLPCLILAGKSLFDCFAGLIHSFAGRFPGTFYSTFSGLRASLNSPAGGFDSTLHSPFSDLRTPLNSFARSLPGALDLARRRTMMGSRCRIFWRRLVRCCLLRTRDRTKKPHQAKRHKEQENLPSNRSNHCCTRHGFPRSCKPGLRRNLGLHDQKWFLGLSAQGKSLKVVVLVKEFHQSDE